MGDPIDASSESAAGPVIGFLHQSGALLDVPDEWSPALIDINVPVDQRQSVRVTRNGIALPTFLKHLAGRERILAEWPRSGVGNYRITLSNDSVVNERTVT